jgi:hypothetical protein
MVMLSYQCSLSEQQAAFSRSRQSDLIATRQLEQNLRPATGVGLLRNDRDLTSAKVEYLLNVVSAHVETFSQSFLPSQKDARDHLTWDLRNNGLHFRKQFFWRRVPFINQSIFQITKGEELARPWVGTIVG